MRARSRVAAVCGFFVLSMCFVTTAFAQNANYVQLQSFKLQYGVATPGFDSSLPSIILTHGLQPGSTTYQEAVTGPQFGPGSYFGLAPISSALVLRESQANGFGDVNLLTFNWPEAFTAWYDQPEALRATSVEGLNLASEFEALAGPNYVEPIQFIGHSDGTVLNAYAANALAFTTNYNIEQFTILDAPMSVEGVSVDTVGVPQSLVSAALFQRLLPAGTVKYVDNFYAPGGTLGFGEPIAGAAANGGVVIPECSLGGPDGTSCIVPDNILDTSTWGHNQVYSNFYPAEILGTTGLDIPGWISPALNNVPTLPAELWAPPSSQTWSDTSAPAGITFEIPDGGQVVVSGTLFNQGTIFLNGKFSSTSLVVQGEIFHFEDGTFSGPLGVTLSGGGTIVLSDNPNDQIFGISPVFCEGLCFAIGTTAQLINMDNIIEGAGTIGNGPGFLQTRLDLINHGLVDANASNPLILALWTNSANDGTMQASNGGTLIFQRGTIDNTGGTIQALNASTVEFQGGEVDNGVVQAKSGGTVNLAGGSLNNVGLLALDGGTVNLTSGTITASTLVAVGSGLIQTTPGFGSATLNDVTIGSGTTLHVNDNGFITLSGVLSGKL